MCKAQHNNIQKEDVMKTEKNLQGFLSDLAVLNVKLHNLHWNVEGKLFFVLHEKTEELYDYVFEQFDEVAELMKINNVFPLASMKDYLANASIKELDSKTFTTEEVVRVVIEDLTTLKKNATSIRNEADEAGEFTTVMLFEDIVAELDKNLWFFRSL